MLECDLYDDFFFFKASSGDTANPFLVPSLPNGNSKPGKPPVKLDR